MNYVSHETRFTRSSPHNEVNTTRCSARPRALSTLGDGCLSSLLLAIYLGTKPQRKSSQDHSATSSPQETLYLWRRTLRMHKSSIYEARGSRTVPVDLVHRRKSSHLVKLDSPLQRDWCKRNTVPIGCHSDATTLAGLAPHARHNLALGSLRS